LQAKKITKLVRDRICTSDSSERDAMATRLPKRIDKKKQMKKDKKEKKAKTDGTTCPGKSTEHGIPSQAC